MIAWTVLALIAGAVAIGLCILTSRPGLSTLLSALVTAGGLQLVGRLQLGYFDPFWPIALGYSFGWALVAAGLTLFVWRVATQRLHR